MPSDRTGRLQLCSLGLATSGWLVSGYLLWRVVQLGQGKPPGIDVCSAVFGQGCDLTLLGPSSWQLGLPVAAWGLIYFAVVTFSIAIGGRRLIRFARWTTAVGLGASVALLGVLFTTSLEWCYLCIATHILNALLFASVVKLSDSTAEPTSPDGETVAEPQKTKPYLLMAACLLGLVLQLVLWRMPDSFDQQAMIEVFRAEPLHEIPAAASDPSQGDPGAPARLVVFSSFQCPGCRTFSRYQEFLTTRFGDNLHVVFKHFPLSSECNASTRVNMQPHACAAARAAEAARRQNQFWRFHDCLFEGGPLADETNLAACAEAAGFDRVRWDGDRQSPSAADKVVSDTQLGARLGVNQTPAVFLNGRRVRTLQLNALVFLISAEIDRTAVSGSGPLITDENRTSAE